MTDGPFTESKEAIGGYFLITVPNLEEAVAVARQCPGLEYGAVVEIRPVALECGGQLKSRAKPGERMRVPDSSDNMPMQSADMPQVLENLFRREWGKIVATLTRIFGIERLTLGEDVVQEALARALQTWPYYGVPENPSAWIMRVARNLALDQARRETQVSK